MIYGKEDKVWIDESRAEIPYSRITALERVKEKESYRLLKQAISLNSKLVEFKQLIKDVSEDIYHQAMKAAGTDAAKGKGNFTWFSFDRSIKVEVSINERIDFDDVHIEAARIKLNEFIGGKLSDKDAILVQLVNSAFETTRGKLDAKKVLGLLKFKSKIKADLFQEAMALIEKAIRRPDSKTYYRISELQASGEYKVIDLNFSSI